jgi:hypothetical protein
VALVVAMIAVMVPVMIAIVISRRPVAVVPVARRSAAGNEQACGEQSKH